MCICMLLCIYYENNWGGAVSKNGHTEVNISYFYFLKSTGKFIRIFLDKMQYYYHLILAVELFC